MDIALVVMAAGIGSRFGGVKQLETVGPHDELIIDYSMHDALAAGFNKVVFVLRRDIFHDFMKRIGNRLETLFLARGVRWEYVYQDLDDLPEGRTKPWGTGHAVLTCCNVLHEPFAVINSDDYYGSDSFRKAYAFLSGLSEGSRNQYGIVGFILKNTLSENGGVTRGICSVDGEGFLKEIKETCNILKTESGPAAEERGTLRMLDAEALVSMNIWMFTPEFLDVLKNGFEVFKSRTAEPMKDEFLLPDIVDSLLREGKVSVKVMSTGDRWFGVTYREDLPAVQAGIRELHEKGKYSSSLYDDIANHKKEGQL